ncbi:MATE family efflux transporter [Leptospira gomenensis]|uniref:MATE family efflux transporter n=1 Tax=Leptospira gomenensis TaxID=2484974 RepID=A0A5F1YQX2_9LEPT|nr:MATE family efflux transporter [Leptospira gomenensis]TGK28056.1 MATE family efflux transporter [Leptospira gomenensis]TGK37089.1 MATE family efflux transporter [Leptospira gomenensis]TGK45725.1 MATE family efflux transporter [Leptospira gomenensis]TGK59664.1 MATE family efflux transporter [Leptospira gomenensis]
MKSAFYKLTFYNILANITVPLTGLIDTAILGNLDTHVFMAGAALSEIIFDFVFWMFGFLRMGTTGLTAQSLGERNETESLLILIRSLLLACFFGLGIFLMSPWILDAGFGILKGADDVKAAGTAYYEARISGSIAVLCNYVFIGWFLGRGKSSFVLAATIIANALNILLDFWFILGLGWEAYGAGLATNISQFGMLFVFIFFLIVEWKTSSSLRSAVLRKSDLTSPKSFISLLRLNQDIFLRTLFLILTFSLFRNFSSESGAEVLAANSILLQLILVSAYLVDGAALAMESMAGILYGEKKWKELGELLNLALITGFLFTGIYLGIIFVFPQSTFGAIVKSPSVSILLGEYRYWLVPILEIGAVAFILDGFFIGLARGKILRNSMLISATLFFLPVALLGKADKNNHLLWLSIALLMSGRAITLSFQARKFLREVNESPEFKDEIFSSTSSPEIQRELR